MFRRVNANHYHLANIPFIEKLILFQDYYCGAGIGGDTPGCEGDLKTPTADTKCVKTDAGYTKIDGKSGTSGGADAGAGLTDSNKGVYRKL